MLITFTIVFINITFSSYSNYQKLKDSYLVNALSLLEFLFPCFGHGGHEFLGLFQPLPQVRCRHALQIHNKKHKLIQFMN